MNNQDRTFTYNFPAEAAKAPSGVHPRLTANFAHALMAFFGGGDTPALRDALEDLLEAAEDGEKRKGPRI